MTKSSSERPDPEYAAVFFDRDGTLIEEVNYLSAEDQISLAPGAAEAVRRVNEAGLLAVVVTNQSAVARGFLTENRLLQIHNCLSDLLAENGAHLDAFYYCPHHPEAPEPRYAERCGCRKPEPGMMIEAARQLHIQLSRSYLIGDSARDVEAGHRAGCLSVLVETCGTSRTGPASEDENSFGPPDYSCRDILDGVNWILENQRARQTRGNSGTAR